MTNVRPTALPDVERDVLANWLRGLDLEWIDHASEALWSDDFCALVFHAIRETVADGGKVPADVVARLRAAGVPSEFDERLQSIEIRRCLNVEEAIEKLVECERVRRVSRVGQEIMRAARSYEFDADGLLELVSSRLVDIAHGESLAGIVPEDEGFARYDAWIDELGEGGVYVSTGIPALDRILGGGFRRGRNYVVGARPSLGKTTLGLSFAKAAERATGSPALFFSAELSLEELIERGSAEFRTDEDAVLRDGLSDLQRSSAKKAARSLRIAIDPTEALSVELLVARLRSHIARKGRPSIVLLDYLQLFDTTKPHRSEVERLTEVAEGLRRCARSQNVPLVALAQLNRNADARQEPKLSDLKGAGKLEEGAHSVILLHRPDPENRRSLRLIVAKNRFGPPGEVDVVFDGRRGVVRQAEGDH